jgi:ribonuclease-3
MALDPTGVPFLRIGQLNEPVAKPLEGLENALGHQFRDRELLVRATTHAGADHGRSAAASNERLEFLGDRVLELVVAQLLMEHFPKAPEGDLAPRLTALVRREALTDVARAIDLGAYLVLSPADSASGARDHPKMLADACEAVIAALYLDGGLEAARRFIANAWDGMLTQVDRMPLEPKTALQEWAQGHAKALPIYTVTGSSGVAHDPQFEVRVDVDGLDPVVATGGSKRAAEKAAALAMLQRLGMVVK